MALNYNELILPTAKTVWNCAIYARASTDRQGDTIEHQIMALTEWAKRKSDDREEFSIRPQHIFTDEGWSGHKITILERPAMQGFLRAVERGEVQVLFIKGLSRFNRDKNEAEMLMDWLDSNRVRVLSLEENFDSYGNPAGAKAIFQIHSFLAQLESDKKSISVSIGVRQKAAKGEWTGGKAPYGYKIDQKTHHLVIDSEKSPIVREIFDLALQGWGGFKIASHFNNTKKWHHIDDKRWNTVAVKHILKREAYTGSMVCGRRKVTTTRKIEKIGEKRFFGSKAEKYEQTDRSTWVITPNAHEPIVSKEEFDKVTAMREARSDNRNNGKAIHAPNAKHPLVGILRCAKCGGLMVVHQRTGERSKYAYYICGVKFRAGTAACTGGNVKAQPMEEFLLYTMKEKLEALRNDKEFWLRYETASSDQTNITRKLGSIERQINETVDKLSDLFLNRQDMLATVYERTKTKLEGSIERLEAERRSVTEELQYNQEGQTNALGIKRQIDEFLSSDLPRDDHEELRRWFTTFIDRVELQEVVKARAKRLHVVWKTDRLAEQG